MTRDVRSLLAPRWLAWHAALVVVLVAFTLLGSWQLDSYAHDEPGRETAGTAPLTEVLTPGQRLPAAAVGRTVTASGRYDEGNQLLVPGRRHGDREGYLVVTPLRTGEGVLPVNRGWVAAPDDAALPPPTGAVTVTGVVQPSESERDSAVDVLGDLPDGQVPYLSTVALLDALPYSPDELYDGYVVASAQQPPSVGGPAQVEPRDLGADVGRWRNLGYALQWWLFAGAAVFFWWVVLRRSLRESSPAPPGTPELRR